MSDRTYVFDNNDGGCNNSGMMGLIASLCQNRGLDPNAVLAMMNNNRGNCGGWGDMGAWWIIVLILFGFGGWGNGFGGGFGGRGTAQGLADLGNLVNNDAGRDLIMQAIQGNATAISQLASTVHCDQNALMGAVQNLSTQLCNLGLGQKDLQFAVQNGQQAILSKLCDCCCDFRQQIADFRGDIALQMCQQTGTLSNGQRDITAAVTKGFCDSAYATREQTCELKNAMNEGFARIEYREQQREINQLREQNQQLALAASQAAQTQAIVNQLQPVAKPAYITCSPYQSAFGYPFAGYPYGGYPYGYNNGNCGCNCNNNCNSGCGCC